MEDSHPQTRGCLFSSQESVFCLLPVPQGQPRGRGRGPDPRRRAGGRWAGFQFLRTPEAQLDLDQLYHQQGQEGGPLRCGRPHPALPLRGRHHHILLPRSQLTVSELVKSKVTRDTNIYFHMYQRPIRPLKHLSCLFLFFSQLILT